jgi:uncharacterized membrane protein (UPF0127 family)
MASRKALNGLLMSSDRSSRGLVLGRDAVVACLIGAMTVGCAACQEQGAGAQPAPPAQPSQSPASSKPAEPKPADSKPADAKPADAKPADSKPATTTDGAGSKWPPGWVPMEPANARLETTRVTIGSKSFDLEMALTDEQRFHGLSGRTEIKEGEGMIFVFKNSEERAFVMRDCPIPIDILYLDGTGRIVSVHKMVPELPRTEAERVMSPPKDARGRPMNVPQWAYSNEAYERRLKQYPSRFGTQFVIELREGSIDALKVKSGDKVELDVAGLKKRAK